MIPGEVLPVYVSKPVNHDTYEVIIEWDDQQERVVYSRGSVQQKHLINSGVFPPGLPVLPIEVVADA